MTHKEEEERGAARARSHIGTHPLFGLII